MLIDEFLPEFDFSEHHSVIARANSVRVFSAIRNLSFESSPLTKFLFKLRGLPTSATSLEGLQRMGFILLGERENDEIVLGIVGKFWTPSACIQFIAPMEFVNFKIPGYAKAVWNFALSETPSGGTTLATETRILCLDAKSLMYFRAYWFFVRPFSGIIRMAVLRSIKRQIEDSDR
ncbi:MAG: hypothetical protein HY562_02120 [Ignavibacteriales bacterium]|nr:hypothetical protein [Ignavibacteriales bacterium]